MEIATPVINSNDLKEADKYITKVGKSLRKYSIDEIPQIINIILGDMSLVGPRPKTTYELQKYYYKEQIEIIYSVKPGVTGLQQISGRADLSYLDRIKIELDYIDNRSIVNDFIILLKTPFALFKGGVY